MAEYSEERQATITRRILSLDVLRGAVIVLMALDHIRDVFALTPQRPELMDRLEPGWFFTRWVTHFCAPVFVFLAGTSAFLYGSKVDNKRDLSRFLFARGLWLIVIEVAVVTPSWTFSLPTTAGFLILQVIWAIGWAMIILAGLIWLPTPLTLMFGLTLAAGHNVLDSVSSDQLGSFGWLWKLLHEGNSWIQLSQDPVFGLVILYPLIPWVGVMAVGYAFGPVMKWESARRRVFLLSVGCVVTLLFVGFRFSNIYGNPTPFAPGNSFLDTLMRFLNTEKYPPSFLFLCMTLGPMFLVLACLEKARGIWCDVLATFGKVPFFFYVLHMPTLTLLGMLWFTLRYGRAMVLLTTQQGDLPQAYRPNLLLVYAVWFLVIALMYLLCRWFCRVKQKYDWWWLKYI